MNGRSQQTALSQLLVYPVVRNHPADRGECVHWCLVERNAMRAWRLIRYYIVVFVEFYQRTGECQANSATSEVSGSSAW